MINERSYLFKTLSRRFILTWDDPQKISEELLKQVNIPANFKQNFLTTMVYFIVAYIMVTILATAFAYMLIWVLKLPTAAELGVSRMNDPGFLLSRPYILAINLLCWTIFAILYDRKRRSGAVSLREALSIALLWLVSAMVLDLVFFVVIQTPVSLSAHEFYIDYQPWITLAYVSILAGHLISYVLSRFRTHGLSS
jgi:hypothetical protein